MIPPLPEPAAHLADSLPLFTEAQLLALQASTVEACAITCESKDDGVMETQHDRIWNDAVICCAHAIRSMK